MRILYTLHSGNPGGMEYHVLDLVRGMVNRSHDVHVFCGEGIISDWYKSAGAKVSIQPIHLDIDPVYITKLVDYIKTNNIDVLHSHELKACANSMLAGFLAGVPARVTHIHTPLSEWVFDNSAREAVLKLTTAGYATEVNLFSHMEIALTESRKRVKMQEGIKESKLTIIPNGLDPDNYSQTHLKQQNRHDILSRYGIPQGSFVFGNVSRLTEEKGHNILIEAFAKFCEMEKNANVFLLIAGGGKLESELTQKISQTGLQDRIKITGVFDDDIKQKIYSAFDAFIFPSKAEGFGLVLMEAMASGLPIISSDLEVLQEVGGSAVLYFNTGNAADLAQKTVDLYLRRDNLEQLKQNAVDRIKDLYTLEKFEQSYEDLYLQILEKK